MFRTLCAIVLLTPLLGCMPRFERPELTVANVTLQDAKFTEQHFLVTLHVRNPNPRPIPVDSVEAHVSLAGEPLGDALSESAFTVPAAGETDFAVSVRTNLASGILRVLARLNGGGDSVDYHLSGTLRTGLIYARSIPFDQTGSVKLR